MQVVQTEFIQASPPRAQEPPIRALARQLQLRLRYARLKVDHGWQKQSINEVENLYFHHHHFCGSSAKLSDSRSFVADTARSNGQASSSRSQEISSTVTVFDSRQRPDEILVLRPPDVQQQPSSDNNSVQVDGTTVDASPQLPRSPHAPAVSSQLSAVQDGSDVVSMPPQTSKTEDARETGSRRALPTSDSAISSATAMCAAGGQTVDGTGSRPPHINIRDDALGQNSSTERSAPNIAGSRPSYIHAPVANSPPAAPSGKQLVFTLSTPPTASTSRHSPLTYDSFWSSHSVSATSFGYGPHATTNQSVQSILPPAGQAQTEVSPPSSVPQADADVAMSEAI